MPRSRSRSGSRSRSRSFGFGSATPAEMAAMRKKAQKSIEEKRVILEKLKAGKLSFSDLLHNPKCKKFKVRTVLSHMKGTSYGGADRLMEASGIDATRRLGGLGAEQKRKLLDLMR